MFYSNDAARDYDDYCAYQDKQLEGPPVCSECGQPIQDEHYYEINDEPVCPDCLEANYRRDNF